MKSLPQLFENNRQWAAGIRDSNPDFFPKLAARQNPDYLWIGCSDSRVPANQIVGLAPGELFVHRNVANQIVHTDMNVLSVLQYAVEALNVDHIIVCGHYGCGGVQAAIENTAHGVVREWLSHIREIYERHQADLDALPDDAARQRKMCELNVVEQVIHVGHTTTVQQAWDVGKSLVIHGWIYDLADGELRDLEVCVASAGEHEKLQAER